MRSHLEMLYDFGPSGASFEESRIPAGQTGLTTDYPVGLTMGTRSKAPAAANTDGSVNKGLKRRLAAIVFADVEGYSRLMHDD
ncbi:MAG TPA: hypothetical protein VH835_01610, partial [Dongiaceae bacterium]